MSELCVDAEATKVLQQQHMAYEYIATICKQLGATNLEATQNPHGDYYLGDLLTNTNVLDLLAEQLQGNYAKPVTYNLKYNRNMGDPATVPTMLTNQQVGEKLSKIADFVQGCPQAIEDETYFEFVKFVFAFCQQFEKREDAPRYDFTQTTPTTMQERKVALNHKPDCLSFRDINKQSDTKNIFGNGLWAMYLCVFFGAVGLQFLGSNIQVYMQMELGASAIDTTMFQTTFSLGQLFICPLLHLLSECCGRKPIYAIAMATYVGTSALLILCDKKYVKDFQLGYIYIIRAIQGMFAVIQPLGFTISSDVVAPNKRVMAVALNNIVYQVGALLATVLNAFVIPYIPGWYSTENQYRTVKTSCLISVVFMCLSFLVATFCLKETCPLVLARREARKQGVPFQPKTEKQMSWGATFKFIFGNRNIVLLFCSYILGLGNSVLIFNVSSVLIVRFLDIRSNIDAQTLTSIAALVGIGVTLLLVAVGLIRVLRKIGELRFLIICLCFPIVTSIIRTGPAPQNRVALVFSTIFNQLALGLTDSPFITFASMYAVPENRGRLMGIFQIGNSVARSILPVIGGAITDYHWRNSYTIFTFFSLSSMILLSFVKPPLESNKMAKAKQDVSSVSEAVENGPAEK